MLRRLERTKGERFNMKAWKILAIIGGVLLVVLLIGFSMYVSRRNQMVALKENVQQAWSQVDVVIQRRADLVPNLVATVKGYATHEKEIFENVARARAALAGAQTPASRIAANEQLTGALGRLLAIVENYPDLKANQNFLQLQDELAGTENRIAVERRRYNQAVQAYNTYIQLFPNNLVASIMGFQRNDAYFKAEGEARAVPKVNFNP
jgi:LemA protein